MSTTFLNLKIFFSLKSFFRQYEHMFLLFFLRFATIYVGATKNGRTVALRSGSTSPVYINGELYRSSERKLLPMITLSYEALFALIAICCGAGYKLGRDMQKAKK